ncbi:hypothetical protein ACCO45_005042 [Purpureocillium lilacinum]|uniref:Uncharacterized protein n=1 Tax=Purpureocillium lilacinum TaxID=33203 RepID=A0ACC4DUB1_PURLI
MKLYPSLSDDLAAWAQRQPGLTDTHFAVLGPNKCAYIDRTGSGCETISHAYENGRLCLMFMSFGNTPRIMRLFCRATVVEWDQPAFPELKALYAPGEDGPPTPVEDILRDGFEPDRKLDELAVFEARPTMDHWASNKAQSNGLVDYQGVNNADSIDGLPGLRSARRETGETLWLRDLTARLKRISAEKEAVAVGFLLAMILYFVLVGFSSLPLKL